ncbi:class I SAM-dependent methyltransferase [Mycobacterium deserti]|uniref:Methyltransferase domain-containing protein n=1 Tax=Mycobacterium deserti TaxID=2978347 RepID=A0ABT2MK25_9MYCO|nr:methyltransferase domain-containing protein [Mycobacterium deserti]MCT7661336.1 methyltransferase domain-containing protein [Mycobacterium deserti]
MDQDPTTITEHGQAWQYEAVAEPMTRQCIPSAFSMVGGIRPGMRVVDIASGPGGLSVAAAQAGAQVLATDISEDMVERAAQRLASYPNCTARVADAHELPLEDGSFDAAFSLFGVVNVPDWRRALRELVRVTRTGGHGCISTWRDPSAVGPLRFLAEALRMTFPDAPALPRPEGVLMLRSPETFRDEMAAAGFHDVDVRIVDVVWSARSVDAFLEQSGPLYERMPPYAELAQADRDRLVPALRSVAEKARTEDGLRVTATALVGAGRR